MAYMNVAWAVSKHATGLPSNVLAQDYGAHIFNILLGTDCDNGNLVAAGDWHSFDVFEEAAVTTFEGEIVQQMPNGNWLVLVKDPGDALLVYQKPLTPYESPKELMKEEAFFNAAGDIVRCYELRKWDRFEASAEAFNGDPEVGATISAVSNKKMTVSASGATGATGATGSTN